MTYDERDRKDLEGKTAMIMLAPYVAEAMTAATGDAWAYAVEDCPSDWQRGEGAANLRAVILTRADGYTVELRPSMAWNEKGKWTGGIVWPRDPLDSSSYGVRRFRNAPGVAYDASEPGIGFDAVKAKARTLGNRIVRELTGPEYTKARADLLARDADAVAENDRAAIWREKVADAAGLTVRDNIDGKPFFHGKPGERAPVKVDSPYPKQARGTLTFDLPSDPDAAAEMVRKVRALVEGDS